MIQLLRFLYMFRFIALPTHGESFLLQKNGSNILVDSGYPRDKLSNMLDDIVPNVDHIHAAVCTHADSDHASGFKPSTKKLATKYFW